MLLNVHSNHSLRYGTLKVEHIVDALSICGYDTAVLTDINNTSFGLEFIRKCQIAEINGLLGVEFRNGDELLYIGIAKNREGFRELNELLTFSNKEKIPLPIIAPNWENVWVVYPYGKKSIASLRVFEYIGVRPTQLNKIRLENNNNYKRYVVWFPISYHRKNGYVLHRQLRAIDHNLLYSQLTSSQIAAPEECFIKKEELLRLYKDFPELISNTEKLLKDCSFEFDFEKSRNKQLFTDSWCNDKELLLRLALEGVSSRYGNNSKNAIDRIHKELEIIDYCKYAAYFLITDDICRYARSLGFHYVGRGSGANSVIAYCLGITEVDPIALDLYFERFLNVKRKNPPDFDIDFCWNQRDDIYNYIFEKYGSENVALMGSMSTFKGRSILRELGKIYGLPKSDIDRLVKDPNSMLNKNEVTEMIVSVYGRMKDFPNQRTIHASGVLISEKPLTYYSALDYPPKGLPTVQFDMYTADEIKLEKFDILSQRGLGHINDCVAMIRENKQQEVNIHQAKTFFEDPKIATQLRSANTIGCFYIESPAMRQLISKLDCDTYPVLVAASSIIRPGVASSGMMKRYIERHRDPQSVDYIHPVFKIQLEETYGVMVYQEDVMKIGHHFGGLDLADADVLRRMMNNKYREKTEVTELKERFFENCRVKKYPEKTIELVWMQMESFAGFSFNKAHSASYAVESYQSLFLKTYFPIEFMAAVLNNYGGFYQRKVYVNEARKSGATIELPCVNNSVVGASINSSTIYLGFDCFLNLESKVAQCIVEERKQNGNYFSLKNFILRTRIGLEQTVLLIRSGAFRFLHVGKKELLWEAHLLMSGQQKIVLKTQTPLFSTSSRKPILPKLETSLLEDLYDEIDLLGFPVSESVFYLAKSDYRGDVFAKDFLQKEGQVVRVVGDFVCDKNVHTKNHQLMKFGNFFDVNGDFIDTVHFPPILAQYPLQGNGVYLIEGKIVLDFGVPTIEVYRCARMPLKPDPRGL